MLQDVFSSVYTKFKLHFYQKVFKKWQTREATLTTVETFCMEIIYGLGTPTINEFASFIEISSPNAAYKVNKLIQKGYLKKVQSEDDRREYHLLVTDKYLDYYNISYQYIGEVMRRIENRFTEEELNKFIEMLEIIDSELMKEATITKKN